MSKERKHSTEAAVSETRRPSRMTNCQESPAASVILGSLGIRIRHCDLLLDLHNESQFLVCLVPFEGLERAGGNMAVHDRALRREDRLPGRFAPTVAEIDRHADTVHFGDEFTTEVGESPIVALKATRTHRICRVVGQLDNTQPEFLERGDVRQKVVESS